MSRGRMNDVEQDAIIRIMGAYPHWSLTRMEDTIFRDIRRVIPNYRRRSQGAYRRWHNNRQRRLATAAATATPPPPPIELTESEEEFFNSTDDESDDEDDQEFERLISSTSTPAPAPAPTPVRKRTFSDCLSKEDLESEMDKLQAAYKRRKEELVKEETACPECPICCETIDKTLGIPAVLASCGHVFCAQCYMRTCSTPLTRYTNTCHTCPMCRSNWDKPNKVHMMPQGATIAACKLKSRDVVTIN